MPDPFVSATLATLAPLPLWVAWQAEERAPGRRTKVPYSAGNGRAKADDPRTWGTRQQAALRAARLPRPFGLGGVGLQLAALDDDRRIGGVDLDACIAPDGAMAPWAAEIIAALGTYAEVSPSGTGAKAFYLFRASDLPALRQAMGSQHGRSWKRPGGEHPPAIELHVGHRFFAVTDQRLPDIPDELRLVDLSTLVWLIREAGPAFARGVSATADAVATPSQSSESPGAAGGVEGRSSRRFGDLKTGTISGAAHDPSRPPALDLSAEDVDLLRRIDDAARGLPLLAQRWHGDWSRLRDVSRSGRAMSVARSLKLAGFTEADVKAALLLHADATLRDWARSADARDFARLFGRAAVPAPNAQGNGAADDADNAVDRRACNVAGLLDALRSAPALSELVAFDRMARAVTLQRAVPGTSETIVSPRPLTDLDVTAVQVALQRSGFPRAAREAVQQAIEMRAQERAFHPVVEHLDALVWDGEPRLAEWLIRYLGTPANDYAKAVGRCWLLSMVARARRPGCQVDHVPVLVGPQGAGKSSVCRVLAGAWFSDALPDIRHSRDAAQHLRGCWMVEIAELAAIGRADRESLKSFVTRREERYRPAYGRLEVVEPRTCVFVASTNDQEFLRDETGGRRFWPIAVGKRIDLAGLADVRDQLLAEADHAFRHGVPWWLDAGFEAREAAPRQEAALESDAWDEAIGLTVAGASRWTIGMVARDALAIPAERLGTLQQRRIAACLTRLGWRRGERQGPARWWVRGDAQA